MPKRNMSSTPGVFITKTGWTGKCLPTTAGTEQVHAEIASSQVEHWSPSRIKAAEKAGYFEDLQRRALKNTRLGLLAELSAEEDET